MKYITYLTIYSGTKLPPFYIGSTTLEKHLKGYHGSVLSKAYKEIYKNELLEHPELFDSCIVSEHPTREEALEAERMYQLRTDAAQNPLFFNRAVAAPKGFFGLSLPKEQHPLYGSHNAKGYIHSYNPITLEQTFAATVPEGYVEGRSPNYKASSHNKGKKWYNNGVDKGLFVEGKQPESWVLGSFLTDEHKKNLKKTDGIYDPDIQKELKELWISTGFLPPYKFREIALAKGFMDGNYHNLVYKIFKPTVTITRPKKIWANDGIKSFMISEIEFNSEIHYKGRL